MSSPLQQAKAQMSRPRAAGRRRENTRDKIVRFLIVCEGQKTEPNYLNAFVRDCQSEIREEEVRGEGRGTCSLVRRTLALRKEIEARRTNPFDRVWLVFDRDDFPDFNKAIELARQNGLQVAWSNESFELWYLLHFQAPADRILRDRCIVMLEHAIRQATGRRNYHYQKADPKLYRIMETYGDREMAARHARRLRRRFAGNTDYASHHPCTLVDILIAELEHPERLLKKLKS